MKTYEVVRELVKMMDDNKPEQKKILWDAFTKMFDLMVEEYEHKKVAAVAVKADKFKAAASPRQKRSLKANARLSTGQRPKRVARPAGTTPRSPTSSAAATPPSTTTST